MNTIENQFTTLNHFLFWIFACRYNDIKQDIAEELASLREEGATLENVSGIRYWTLHDDKQKQSKHNVHTRDDYYENER